MTSFKINIPEFKLFKESLSVDESLKRLIPDISISMLKFNNTLGNRVNELYNIPYALDEVRIGKTVTPVELGRTFLRYSLQYRDKAIPLAKYDFKETPSNSESFAPLRRKPLGSVYWKKGRYSKKILMNIRKNKTTGARLSAANFDKRTGFFTGTNIKARLTDKIWSTEPSKGVEGIRAPYKTLFGPSLITLANSVYEKDSIVKKAYTQLGDEIIQAMVKSYVRD